MRFVSYGKAYTVPGGNTIWLLQDLELLEQISLNLFKPRLSELFELLSKCTRREGSPHGLCFGVDKV
jgi:hypothetical protein